MVIISSANLTLSGNATSGIQKASQTITSGQVIPAGTNVTHQAAKSIILEATSTQGIFISGTDSVFKAEIKACMN